MTSVPRVPKSTPPAERYVPAGAGLDPEAFWRTDRPELAAIYHEAALRLHSPWAVLGCAVAQALLAISYQVRYRSPLKPEGTPLNLAIALVGGPGSGKSSSYPAARAAVEYPSSDVPDPESVRSGEGIPGVYAYLCKDDGNDGSPVWRTQYRRASRAHCILWDESGVFTAQASRTGSTLVETVNTAATGGTLGGQASKGDGLTLASGEYRAVLILNAQPRRAGGLVDDHALASGLTARIQWFSATADEPPTATTHLPPHTVSTAHWNGVSFVDALPEMTAQHRADKLAGLAGVLPAEHGHRTTRGAILAIALAAMNGRSVLTHDDWQLALHLLAHSDEVLNAVRDALSEGDPAEEDGRRRVIAALREKLLSHRAEGRAFLDARRMLTKTHRDALNYLLQDSGLSRGEPLDYEAVLPLTTP